MLQTDFIGTEENTIVANGTDFRQVGVIKGLEKYTNDSDFTGNTGKVTKILTLGSIQGARVLDRQRYIQQCFTDSNSKSFRP